MRIKLTKQCNRLRIGTIIDTADGLIGDGVCELWIRMNRAVRLPDLAEKLIPQPGVTQAAKRGRGRPRKVEQLA